MNYLHGLIPQKYYIKQSMLQGPPENEDSKKRDALKAVHPFIKPQKACKYRFIVKKGSDV